jgi:hypothetical protein
VEARGALLGLCEVVLVDLGVLDAGGFSVAPIDFHCLNGF